MRIVIADYSGHPFQVQLSRELARRGHEVLHLFFPEFQTPKGRLTLGPHDPPSLKIEQIVLGEPFAKYSFVRRYFQEIRVGNKFSLRIASFEPDVVVASNLPLDTLRIVAARSRAMGAAFVFWQQDIYSFAIDRILTEKFGIAGRLLGVHYKRIERTVLKNSQRVIVISEDFIPHLRRDFAMPRDSIEVVENWAPLDDITPQPKANAWSRANAIADKDVVLYTGTLGMKHKPERILAIARALSGRPNSVVVVVSEGPGADWLAAQAKGTKLEALRVIPFQPFALYSDVLGSGDVLLSILEADAGGFSVPSKVLSYLCAGRPIVLGATTENLAARVIASANAGTTVSAADHHAIHSAILGFLDDRQLRAATGARARQFAERTFDIGSIGNRFETIIEDANGRNGRGFARGSGFRPSGGDAPEVTTV
jgi:glycosyltransferase involved in cell wall biosynthesis